MALGDRTKTIDHFITSLDRDTLTCDLPREIPPHSNLPFCDPFLTSHILPKHRRNYHRAVRLLIVL